MKNILINSLRNQKLMEQGEIEKKNKLLESDGDLIKCPNCDADMEIGGVCPECGYKDPSEAPEDKKDELEEDATECPYFSKLEYLVADEEEAIKGYDEAILLFNGIDSADRDVFIEKLNHIKEEELEHIDELETLKKVLHGGVADITEPEIAPDEVPVAVPEEPSEEDEIEVIQEALGEDDEIYKMLANKTFADYSEVEALLIKEGYEVTEVFREGAGFNMSAMKDGTEYYIPFANGDKGYFAVLDSSLSEGKLGDWFASKVATVMDKATGAIDKGRRINFLKQVSTTLDDVLDGYTCKMDGDNINIVPDSGYVARVNVGDDGGLVVTNAEGKKATLDPKKLDDGLKAAGLKVKDSSVPTVEEVPGEQDDELANIGKRLKELGVTPEKIADMMK